MGGTKVTEDSDEVRGLLATIHKLDAELAAERAETTRLRERVAVLDRDGGQTDTEHRRGREVLAELAAKKSRGTGLDMPHDPPPPVDRSQRATLHGMDPDGAEHRETGPDGMQKDYIILSDGERTKGFVRPVRRSYVHAKCGSVTSMGLKLAETYARDPAFYSGTFCATCRAHFPVGAEGEFTWAGTTEKVGT